MPERRAIEITEEQALCFRARRGHLAGAGAPSSAAAAKAILGAQAQQLAPALHALSLRTRGRPPAGRVQRQLLGAARRLVRTWGQRDTLHVYDPKDWPLVVAARAEWSSGPRGGPMPTRASEDKALKALHALGRPATRSDVLDIAPPRDVKAIAERAAQASMDAERLAAGRLLWRLSHRGEVCVAGKVGAEQAYATRAAWFPHLAWEPPAPFDAAVELARRYLAVHAPATAKDVAHFFDAKVSAARTWLDALDGELIDVECNGRKGLLALAGDARELATAPAPASRKTAWPLRLLPMWDCLLMAHADKSWTVPAADDRAAVWRKAAMVAAVAIARGRVVATWTSRARRGALDVQVHPLSGWRQAHLAEARREAAEVARCVGAERTCVTVA